MKNRSKNISGAVTMIAFSLLIMVSSCKSDLSPGYEYMPDMYRSPSMETYVDYENPDSMMARQPVTGTIAYSDDPEKTYNNLPYAYPNTNEGYEAAGANLKSPLELNAANLEEGKIIYTKFCTHCHGDAGAGDGTMVKNDKFPPVPSYSGPQLKDLNEGKMFHSITFGKGLMGPHAPLLNKEERWKVIQYVQKLQKGNSAPAAANTDTLK